jgi:hypothetical protein
MLGQLARRVRLGLRELLVQVGQLALLALKGRLDLKALLALPVQLALLPVSPDLPAQLERLVLLVPLVLLVRSLARLALLVLLELLVLTVLPVLLVRLGLVVLLGQLARPDRLVQHLQLPDQPDQLVPLGQRQLLLDLQVLEDPPDQQAHQEPTQQRSQQY